MISLKNTLTRQKEPFIPIQKERVSFYTCGPTVYHFAHIGNFRAYIASDILRRWFLMGENMRVDWVLNITDVDDKTIRDARKKYPNLPPKEALKKFTRFYENIFFEDLATLNIPQSVFLKNPRATESLEGMRDLITKIYHNGFAKIIDGSVFFDVKKWAEADRYGKLVSIDFDALQIGMRSLADEIKKEDAADFVLWKAQKEGEPAWDFSLDGHALPGRPGWHIECSAMEREAFGLPFDIHSGGVDLCFPHHENEIAQSKCGYGVEPTHYWMHNEHLMVDGKKMSKSLGNFYTLRDLLKKGHSADAVRFFLATNHYDTKLNMTEEALFSAQKALTRLRHFFTSTQEDTRGEGCRPTPLFPFLKKAKADFYAAMRNDLATPVAIAVIYRLVRDLSPHLPFSASEKKELTLFFQFVGDVFGVSLFSQKTEIPDEVFALAQQRQKAREEKNWAESDRLRDCIAKKGFVITDAANDFSLSVLQ